MTSKPDKKSVPSAKTQAADTGASTKILQHKTGKKNKVRTNHKCSWCENITDHIQISHNFALRSIYQCTGCRKNTVRCRNPLCDAMSRHHQGWSEGFCIDHTPLYNEKQCEGNCSWCFKRTTHEIHMDSVFNRVLMLKGKIWSCSNCRRPTQKCEKCEDGMVRMGEDVTSKCFKCAGLITTWDDPDYNHQSLTITAYCPWCLQNCGQALKSCHKKKATKNTYQCTSCTLDTKKCSSCNSSMCLDSSKKAKCIPCSLSRGVEVWEGGRSSFDQRCAAYNQNLGIQEMNRSTTFRDKAQTQGLIRPFMLLVSMHPQMRATVAAKLDIPLLLKSVVGNPHAEADLILFHPKKGIQRRSSGILETVGVSTKCNWYQILRRATNDLMGYSTFKAKNADKTFQECANPSSEVLNALELELLNHLAERYLQMFDNDLREKAEELYNSPQIFGMFAEMRAEGINTDAICIMFVGIVLSSGVNNGRLSMNAKQIQLDDFLVYLRSYLNSRTSMGDTVEDAQFATAQVAFFIARVVVVGTLLQVISLFICPPIMPLIQAGLLTLGIAMLVGAFFCRPSRDVSSQAVVVIVFQHFLLSTHNVHLGNNI